MKPSRRQFVQQIGYGMAAAALPWLPRAAGAQADTGKAARDYPLKPITLVVPGPAGGAADAVTRALAQEMGKSLGQALVVDNKPGASGMLAAQIVSRSAPDGYTLLMTHSTPIYYAPYMFSKMAYDPGRDLSFITHLCDAALVLAVNKDVPVNNMAELVAWARKNKGSVAYGSYGVGSAGHLMSAYLNDSRKLDMTHVAYKSEAPHIQDLVGGVVSWGLGTVAAAQGVIKDQRVRPIAIFGPRRLADMPEVATMAEQGFPDAEFNTVAWFTLLAPAGTPKPILQRLEKEAVEIIHSTAMKARFQVFGLESVPGGAAQFRKDFDAVDPVIQKLVKISGVKMD